MYVGIRFDSWVQQTGADLKAISLRQVKRVGSSYRPASFDLEHVLITFQSAVEVVNNLLCDLHVGVAEFSHAAWWHNSEAPKLFF